MEKIYYIMVEYHGKFLTAHKGTISELVKAYAYDLERVNYYSGHKVSGCPKTIGTLVSSLNKCSALCDCYVYGYSRITEKRYNELTGK